jgi:hypothetical protein
MLKLLLATYSVYASCPSSVVLGAPDSPVELADSLKDDPAFARMHLANIARSLPGIQKSCRQGVEANCRLAEFVERAKAGLECYAGIPGTAHAQAVGQSQNQAANSGRCKPNLKHVGTWADAGVRAPEVQQMMDAVQAQDVREAMRKARLQGFSTEAMIKATEDQALQFDRVARESSQCAAETDAFGATDAQFLKQAPLVLPASCSGIRNACVCSVAVNRLSAIAARELAKQMRCFASVDIGGNGSPTNAGQADVPTNQNRSNASAGSPTCPAGLVRLPWGCRDPNEDPFGGSKR